MRYTEQEIKSLISINKLIIDEYYELNNELTKHLTYQEWRSTVIEYLEHTTEEMNYP